MARVPLLSARGLKKSFGGRLVLDLHRAAAPAVRHAAEGDRAAATSDIDSIEVLEDALEHYASTVVAVSHDRYFPDRIADRIVVVADGAAQTYEGGLSANVARV